MNNNFDKALLIPIGLLIISGLLVIFYIGESYGTSRGEMNMKEAAVKANVAEWVSDKDGKPEFKFKQ